MKAYGVTRKDKVNCNCGSCISAKGARKPVANRRRARKAARRSNRVVVNAK